MAYVSEVAEALTLEGSNKSTRITNLNENHNDEIYEVNVESKEPAKEDIFNKMMNDIIEQYLFVNSPIINKMTALRNNELQSIYQTKEFQHFKDTLPIDQHITVDGYIIYRQKIERVKEGLPGFGNEVTYEYKYDNPKEDITMLFGSNEYCETMKALSKEVLSWEEFCKKYYDNPPETMFTKFLREKDELKKYVEKHRRNI